MHCVMYLGGHQSPWKLSTVGMETQEVVVSGQLKKSGLGFSPALGNHHLLCFYPATEELCADLKRFGSGRQVHQSSTVVCSSFSSFPLVFLHSANVEVAEEASA